jgi:serine/threonine protein kinase
VIVQVIEARLGRGEAPPVAGAAADVWSAGAILFALLGGAPPFFRPSDAALPPQPKAVATLLRINTGSRNAVHGQVTA